VRGTLTSLKFRGPTDTSRPVRPGQPFQPLMYAGRQASYPYTSASWIHLKSWYTATSPLLPVAEQAWWSPARPRSGDIFTYNLHIAFFDALEDASVFVKRGHTFAAALYSASVLHCRARRRALVLDSIRCSLSRKNPNIHTPDGQCPHQYVILLSLIRHEKHPY
jgi:hypothetical protein